MDGTAIVALLIVIMFFSSYPRNLASTAKPAPQPATQTTVQETAPVNNSVTYPPTSTTPPADEAIGYIDNSPAPYQNISGDRMDKVIRKYNKVISVQDAEQIKASVNKYCQEKDLDPRLVLALMARESAFKSTAVSSSGAVGLGQILPLNYEQLKITNPYDIDQNCRGTVTYIKMKLDDWKGNSDQVGLGLASYLKGTGDIKRAGSTYSGHAETYVNDILRIRSQI